MNIQINWLKIFLAIAIGLALIAAVSFWQIQNKTIDVEEIAPVFQKIVDYLDGRDWTRDNAIKQGIADLKERNEPIEVIQGYLQYLEVSGHLETRNAGRNGLEAKKI